jgi:AraC-like DNA-binding protein
MYREHAPPPALAAYVDRFWTSDAAPAGPLRRILPDGCIDILVELDGDAATLHVVGTMTRAIVVPAYARNRVVAVRFRPGGAPRFLRVDADELTDADVELRALGLALEVDPREPLQSLVGWLLARVAGPASDPAEHAIGRLLAASPSIPALARETGWSRQWLTRACRRRVGIPPKQLGRVARMQRAIIALQDAPHVPLAVAAVALGYFDQAHMTKDFRELAGATPRAAVSIFPIRSIYAAP